MAAGRWWRKYRGWIAVAVLVAVGATVLVVWRDTKTEVTPTTYTTSTAETGTISVTVAGTGNLAVRDLVTVSPKTSGTIASVKVSAGETVAVGDALYTLDAETAEKATAQAASAKRQAAAQVDQSELSVLQAEESLDRLGSRAATSPEGVASDAEIEIAEKQLAIAKDGLTAAKASYSSAVADYYDAVDAQNDLVVTAPCSGTVWTMDLAAGDSVSVGGGGTSTAAASTASSGSGSTSAGGLTIARDSELAVLLSVNEVDVPLLKVGQSVDVAFDALPDLTVTGKVDEIATEGTVSQGVVTYDVWVSLDVLDAALRTGMTSSASIVTSVARDALLVPNAAIKTNSDDETTYVQVMDPGAAAPRDVTVTAGLEGASQTVVLRGIKAGDVVVTKTIEGSSGGSTSTSRNQGGGMMIPGMGGGPAGGGPGD